MAKKKTGERKASPELMNAFQCGGKKSDNPDRTFDMAMEALTDEQKGQFVMMYTLASSGVTPDEYNQFYQIFQTAGKLANGLFDNVEGDGIENDDDDATFPFPGIGFRKSRCKVKEYDPLDDACNRSLVLKIQMKGVNKPPMWREVELPADFDFLQLHEVIQEVMGFEDCHLWQFNMEAYDDTLQIGVEMNPDSPFGKGLDFVTHEAEETVLTRFLHQKGDKLEYVYDFGDDWIFVVEVKDVIAKKNEHPVCRKYKSELNAIEDFGGTWAYQEARADLEEWDTLSAKEKRHRTKEQGFDTAKEYYEFLSEHIIDLDYINDALIGM